MTHDSAARALVTVVVPAHDSAATLPRTLDSLADQTLAEPYEVIVVDDGSRDGTAEVAERTSGPVRVLRQDAAGAAAARNRGAQAAEGAILAFTDSDCHPTRTWLEEGVRALGDADLVVGAVRPDPQAPMGPFDRSLVVERETGLYETANVFVRRDLFTRIGGFESWIHDRGRPLSEDVWLGWRARRAGARTSFCDAAVVDHEVFPRGAREYVDERRRLAHFPSMTARIPELRDQFLWRRWFLSRRTAMFDAALAGSAAALLTRRPVALLAVLPYARLTARRAVVYRRRAPLVAAVDVAADAVGAVALARASLRERTPVL